MSDVSPKLDRTLKEVENEYVLAVLTQEHGNRKATAFILGISYRWLLYKLADFRAEGMAVPPGIPNRWAKRAS